MMDGHDDVLFCVETNDFAKHLTDIKLLLRLDAPRDLPRSRSHRPELDARVDWTAREKEKANEKSRNVGGSK